MIEEDDILAAFDALFDDVQFENEARPMSAYHFSGIALEYVEKPDAPGDERLAIVDGHPVIIRSANKNKEPAMTPKPPPTNDDFENRFNYHKPGSPAVAQAILVNNAQNRHEAEVRKQKRDG